MQALETDFSHFLTAFFDSEFAAFIPKPAQYHELMKLTEHKANANHSVLLKLTDICDATDLRTEIKSLQICYQIVKLFCLKLQTGVYSRLIPTQVLL